MAANRALQEGVICQSAYSVSGVLTPLRQNSRPVANPIPNAQYSSRIRDYMQLAIHPFGSPEAGLYIAGRSTEARLRAATAFISCSKPKTFS